MNQLTVDCSMGVVRELFQEPHSCTIHMEWSKSRFEIPKQIQNVVNKTLN